MTTEIPVDGVSPIGRLSELRPRILEFSPDGNDARADVRVTRSSRKKKDELVVLDPDVDGDDDEDVGPVAPPGRTGPRKVKRPRTAGKAAAASALRAQDQPGARHGRALASAQYGAEADLQKMQVILRIRPLPSHLSGASECMAASDNSTVVLTAPVGSLGYKVGERSSQHQFSRVFSSATGQDELFEETARPLVDDFVAHSGRHFVLFAYGVTASGKTYTVEGSPGSPGLLPRAMGRIFAMIEKAQEESRRGLSVVVANYEVYNEQLYDLLSAENDSRPDKQARKPRLKLKEGSDGRVFIQGLSEITVASANQALEVIQRGSSNRRKADTTLNSMSSRSHSVFTVTLLGTSGERLSKLSFVDLAGSERATRTKNQGTRLREAISINSSLMTLGRCLQALRSGQQEKRGAAPVIPYRESKITHLFRDALHGWGRITLVTCVSPHPSEYDETAHVLRYAAIASQIKVAAGLMAAPEPEAPPAKRKRGARGEEEEGAQAGKGEGARQGTAMRIGVGERQLRARLEEARERMAFLEEENEDLRLELNNLKGEVIEREKRLVSAEAEIREEVAQEMEEAMAELEKGFQQRMENRLAQVERDFGIDLGVSHARGGTAEKPGHGRARRTRQKREGGGAGGKTLKEQLANAERRVEELEARLDAEGENDGEVVGRLMELEEERERREAAEGRAKELERAVEEAEGRARELGREMKRADRRARRAEEEARALAARLEEKSAELDRAMVALSEMSDTMERGKLVLDQAQSLLATKEREVSRMLEGEREEAQKVLIAAVEELEERARSAEEAERAARDEAAEQRRAAERAAAGRAAAEAEISALKNRSSKAAMTAAQAARKIEELCGAAIRAKAKAKTAMAEARAREKAAQEAAARVQRKEDAMGRMRAELERKRDRIGELTKKLEETELELENAAGEAARAQALDAMVRELSSELEALSASLKRAEEEGARWRRNCELAGREKEAREELERAMERLSRELDAAEKERERMGRELDAAEKERERLSKERDELVSRRGALEKEVDVPRTRGSRERSQHAESEHAERSAPPMELEHSGEEEGAAMATEEATVREVAAEVDAAVASPEEAEIAEMKATKRGGRRAGGAKEVAEACAEGDAEEGERGEEGTRGRRKKRTEAEWREEGGGGKRGRRRTEVREEGKGNEEGRDTEEVGEQAETEGVEERKKKGHGNGAGTGEAATGKREGNEAERRRKLRAINAAASKEGRRVLGEGAGKKTRRGAAAVAEADFVMYAVSAAAAVPLPANAAEPPSESGENKENGPGAARAGPVGTPEAPPLQESARNVQEKPKRGKRLLGKTPAKPIRRSFSPSGIDVERRPRRRAAIKAEEAMASQLDVAEIGALFGAPRRQRGRR